MGAVTVMNDDEAENLWKIIVRTYSSAWDMIEDLVNKCIFREKTTIVSPRATAPWHHNMLTWAAGDVLPPASSLFEGGGAYEYIWGIHGYLNRGATDRGDSESEK